jgi:ABC-2 type transport system permease protein
LGARLPNTREHSPARIAAGFGGTLTLVISTLYILAIVLMTAVPYHFYLAAESQQTSDLLAEAVRFRWWLRTWLIAGTAGSVVLGAVATVVPMWIGFRAFRRWEF